MNLYFRFIFLVLSRVLFSKRQEISDTCVTKFRVSLFDLDLNFHMNNGRFFTIMDLGRFDLLLGTGFFFKLIRHGYYPVVLSESAVFRRSLTLFQKFSVETSIDSIDHKFFYMTQKFVHEDRLVASTNVRVCFKNWGRKGVVPPEELYEFFGVPYEHKELSPLAQKQIELDDALAPRQV